MGRVKRGGSFVRRLALVGALAVAVSLAASTAAYADSSTQMCNQDVSLSWTVCVTVYYNTITYHYSPADAVDYYTVRYTVQDSTVSISAADLKMTINGIDTNGNYWISHVQDVQLGSGGYAVPGTTYTVYPSWRNVYIQMSPAHNNGAYLEAGARGVLHRGGSSWNFNSYNVCTANSSTSGYLGNCNQIP
jgi:uncharacterized protein (DUF2141 family)